MLRRSGLAEASCGPGRIAYSRQRNPLLCESRLGLSSLADRNGCAIPTNQWRQAFWFRRMH